ncbi:hypothetical protein SD436_00085 [Streptococcus sp. 2A/TPW/M5]
MKKAGKRIQSSIDYIRFCRNKVQQSLPKEDSLAQSKKQEKKD